MRSHLRNSPEAAGRLVALVLLADGHVCRSEIDALDHHEASRALGLAPGAMSRLLQELCEDFVDGMCTTGSMLACLDDSMMSALLRDVDDTRLQDEVLRLARAAAGADRHLSDGESWVIDAMQRHWLIADHEVAPVHCAEPKAA
jgi:hypothetical protein